MAEIAFYDLLRIETEAVLTLLLALSGCTAICEQNLCNKYSWKFGRKTIYWIVT